MSKSSTRHIDHLVEMLGQLRTAAPDFFRTARSIVYDYDRRVRYERQLKAELEDGFHRKVRKNGTRHK